MNLYLLPAYGRSYTSYPAALRDWQGGKDFKIRGGPYCSSRDAETLKADGFTTVVLVYGNNWEQTFRVSL